MGAMGGKTPAPPPTDPEPDIEEDDGIPDEPEPDMDEVMDAAKTDALEDDWACMKEPPWGNDKMPGMRYGASIEIRPLTVVLPCPCAGGVWNPSHEDDGARLDWTGLWHEPSKSHGTIAGLPHPDLTMMAYPPEMEPRHRSDLIEDHEKELAKYADKTGMPPADLEHQRQGGHVVVRDHEDNIDEDHESVPDWTVDSANEAVGAKIQELAHQKQQERLAAIDEAIADGGGTIETSELEISQSSPRDGNARPTPDQETSRASQPSSRHHDILVAAAAKKRKLTTKSAGVVKHRAAVRGHRHDHHQFPHHKRRPSNRSIIASINVAPAGHPPRMSSFMLPSAEAFETYYPGSEPYSIDFGCAKGTMRDLLTRKWKPGMRWKDVPGWTAVVVPTPCPCALGVFTRAQPPPVSHLPPTPDSLFMDPDLGGLTNAKAAPWQGPNSTQLGSMGLAGVMIALLSALAGTTASPGCARRRRGFPTDVACPVRRPVSGSRAAQDFSSFL